MKLAESDVLSSFDSFILSYRIRIRETFLKKGCYKYDDYTRLWLYSVSHLYRFVSACNCFDVTDSFDRSTRETTFQKRSNGRAPQSSQFYFDRSNQVRTRLSPRRPPAPSALEALLVNEIKRFRLLEYQHLLIPPLKKDSLSIDWTRVIQIEWICPRE